MKRYSISSIISTLTLALTMAMAMGSSVPAQGPPAQSRQQIEQVVENFRKAVINKDKDGFMKLFVREDITWMASFDDAGLARMNANRAARPLPPNQKIYSSSPRQFIEGIASAPLALKETFHNIRIDTNGDVA